MTGQGFNLLLGVILFHIICTLGSSCHWHLFKHYEQKGCRAEIGQDGCPVRFQCEKLSPEDYKTCVHNGKIYKDGDKIQEVSACDNCKCKVDTHGSASIECAAVDCPDWEAKNKSCYMGYIPDTCCPTEICPDDKNAPGCTQLAPYCLTVTYYGSGYQWLRHAPPATLSRSLELVYSWLHVIHSILSYCYILLYQNTAHVVALFHLFENFKFFSGSI